MCATRVKEKEKPEIRMVHVGSRRLAYWEAGAAYMPYSKGYFPAEATAAAAFTWAYGSAYGAAWSGAGDFSGGIGGDVGGDFGGGFDGGGGDVG